MKIDVQFMIIISMYNVYLFFQRSLKICNVRYCYHRQYEMFFHIQSILSVFAPDKFQTCKIQT